MRLEVVAAAVGAVAEVWWCRRRRVEVATRFALESQPTLTTSLVAHRCSRRHGGQWERRRRLQRTRRLGMHAMLTLFFTCRARGVQPHAGPVTLGAAQDFACAQDTDHMQPVESCLSVPRLDEIALRNSCLQLPRLNSFIVDKLNSAVSFDIRDASHANCSCNHVSAVGNASFSSIASCNPHKSIRRRSKRGSRCFIHMPPPPSLAAFECPGRVGITRSKAHQPATAHLLWTHSHRRPPHQLRQLCASRTTHQDRAQTTQHANPSLLGRDKSAHQPRLRIVLQRF